MPCNNNQQIRYCLVEIIWLTWTPFICCHTQGLHFKTKKAWRHKAINPVREKEKAIIMWFKSNGGLSIYIILYQQQGRTIFFLDNRQWWQFKTECKPKNIIKKNNVCFLCTCIHEKYFSSISILLKYPTFLKYDTADIYGQVVFF